MQNVSSSNSQAVNVPKLRFPGFTDEWSVSSFSETFEFLSNNTLSRAELAEDGEVKNIHYGDILTKFGDVVDCSKEELPFIADKAKLGSKTSYLRNGDVIIADTAEDDAVGKATEIFNIKAPVVSGLHTMACRPRFEFEPRFLGYYINSACYHNQLYPYMQGVKVTSVSKGNIALTEIRYPTKKEQQKISTMVTLVDARIEKQKCLIDSLKLYKRGVSRFVFSRKLFFYEKSSEWKKTTIGKVCNITMGQSPDSESYNTENIGLPLVQGNADMKNRITHPQRYTSAPTKTAEIGDVILSVRAPVGTVGRANQKVCLGRGVCSISGDNNDFLYHYFIENETYWKRVEQGGTFTAIRGNDIAEMSINLPPKNEIRKISDFLNLIDNRVSAAETMLDLLLKSKSALLQQMFI